MSDGKVTRAELAEAVRELREEVAWLRAAQAAHGCHCGHLCISVPVVVPPPPPVPTWVQPYQVTCDTTTVGVNPHPTTCATAGVPPAVGVPVLGYEMRGGAVVGSGYTVSASN
jgi:hypothetical protein